MNNSRQKRSEFAEKLLKNSEDKFANQQVEDARSKCKAPGLTAEWDDFKKMVYFVNELGKRYYDCPIPTSGQWLPRMSSKNKPFWVSLEDPSKTSWFKPQGENVLFVDMNGNRIEGGRRKQTRRAKRRGRKTRSRC
jgi:hypothetical protein